MAIWGSLIKYWPYNLSLTLDNYEAAGAFAAAKKAAVDNIVNYANNTISWAEKFYNVDLPSLTVPGATVASGGTLPPGVNPMPPPGKQLPTTTGPYPTPTSTYGPGWTGDTPQGPQVPQPYRPVWESTGA